MQEMDQLEEAKTLLEEALQGRRKTLGGRHRHTLKSICTMGELLHAMGQLKMARLVLEEALRGQKETLGDNHQHTRNTIDKLLKLGSSSKLGICQTFTQRVVRLDGCVWLAACIAAGHAARMVSV